MGGKGTRWLMAGMICIMMYWGTNRGIEVTPGHRTSI